MKSRILASLFLVVYFVSESYGRDLLIEVKSGKVQKKDTFSTDAYMSVTVCKEKQRTPTVKSNLNPVWNWAHTVSFKRITRSTVTNLIILFALVQERSRHMPTQVSSLWRWLRLRWHYWRNGDNGWEFSSWEGRGEHTCIWKEGRQSDQSPSQIYRHLWGRFWSTFSNQSWASLPSNKPWPSFP